MMANTIQETKLNQLLEEVKKISRQIKVRNNKSNVRLKESIKSALPETAGELDEWLDKGVFPLIQEKVTTHVSHLIKKEVAVKSPGKDLGCPNWLWPTDHHFGC